MSFRIGNFTYNATSLYDFIHNIYLNRQGIDFVYSKIHRGTNNRYFIEIGENLYALDCIRVSPNDLKTLTWRNYYYDLIREQSRSISTKYLKRRWIGTVNVNRGDLTEIAPESLSLENFIKFFTYYSLFYLHGL